VNGDGLRDIIVGTGPGWLPYVDVYSGAAIFTGKPPALLYQPLPEPNYIRTGFVVATTPVGGGDPGAVEAVSVVNAYNGQVVRSGLEMPILHGPSGSVTSLTPDLCWESVTGAQSYQVELVDMTGGVVGPVHYYRVTDTDFRIPFALTKGRTY